MDKNMLAGLEGLPEQDKARMTAMIDHLQLRDRFFCFFPHLCLIYFLFSASCLSILDQPSIRFSISICSASFHFRVIEDLNVKLLSCNSNNDLRSFMC